MFYYICILFYIYKNINIYKRLIKKKKKKKSKTYKKG